MRPRFAVLAAVLSLSAGSACAAAPLLLQQPTVSRTDIVFGYANDLWIVPRAGGDARVLVHAADRASRAYFSPDGTRIAYSARVGGNTDVYVVAAAGGEPRRLTWHPADDVVEGWTRDGRSVLFGSHREVSNDSGRLYTVGVEGGPQSPLPLARAEGGAYSPDGTHIAYEPDFQWEPDWRGYRGGQTTPIWIASLADSSIVRIPRDNSNDRDPMWIGDTVYFLSDRDGASTLYAYDTKSAAVTRLIDNSGYPIDAASAGPDAIVYSQMGVLHLFDLAAKKDQVVDVRVADDGARLAPYFATVGKHIENAALSPTGARALFDAHGEILSVPAEKGDVRNLTRTPGIAERDPAWSADGKSVAYFSDASGEYALHIRAQDGLGEPRVIALGEPPSFFYTPLWSPDSKHILYRDKRLNLWRVDLATAKPVKIDSDRFDSPLHEFDATWSPDSRWIAYAKQLPNHLRAVFVYSLDTGRAVQVSDGMSDCLYPAFDRNGKYLYFTASTDVALSAGWLDMTSDAHPVTRSVYVAVLRKDLPSPIAPESDEDKGVAADAKDKDKKDDKKDGADAKPAPVSIDFAGILQRTLALPLPAANYVGLAAGKSGELFVLQSAQVPGPDAPFTVQKFTLEKRKTDKLLDDVNRFALSFDGSKMLFARKDDWHIVKTEAAPKDGGEGKIATDAIRVEVDPRKEWAQMYREVWRIQRDFFYDPHFHGLDLATAEKHFEPFLAGIASRNDLDTLFRRMLAYMSVGHMFVTAPPPDDAAKIDVGLLGADYAVDNGRYRFAKVYDGENWNPDLHAPLTQPGVNVKAGEYLLAVNGRELHARDDVYAFFQDAANKQTVLRVAADAAGTGARNVTVVPVPSERGLRHRDWVESNRRKVDQLSGGKLAYVHLPDTANGGFTSFNRYFFAQTDKQGAVIDERYNHGGQLADYIVDYLRRPPMTRIYSREGEAYTEPTQAIFGPKAMLINQFSGSGGDALPWYFKRMQVGPLIGKRTWGGLVGIGGYPPLIDGGNVTAPRWALAGLEGEWEVENRGIAPDIDIDDDPQAERAGHDPQLERAVAYLMKELAEHPAPTYKMPAYPDFKPGIR